eukprot:1116168-Amorphochlora_amoeboformis.AAC.3
MAISSAYAEITLCRDEAKLAQGQGIHEEASDILVNIVYLPWVIYFVVNSILVDIPYWTVEVPNAKRISLSPHLFSFRVAGWELPRIANGQTHLANDAAPSGCWTRCLHFFGMLDALCEISVK